MIGDALLANATGLQVFYERKTRRLRWVFWIACRHVFQRWIEGV